METAWLKLAHILEHRGRMQEGLVSLAFYMDVFIDPLPAAKNCINRCIGMLIWWVTCGF